MEGSLETIWSIHASLPFTEGALRSRKRKVFGPGHPASVAETGLELGSPDFPRSFTTSHSGEGKEKRGLGAWGQSDKRYVGSSRLLIRDLQCHSKGIFYQDVIFPTVHDFLSRAD